MKKLIMALMMLIFASFATANIIFYDDFNDGNVTSDNWQISVCNPDEGGGYLNATNAGCGGGVYQQFANMTWYDTEWNAYINATYIQDAADDYVMFTLGDATDTSGNTFYIRYLYNVGFNGTYYLETVFYGDCTITDGGLGAVALDVNYTEENLLRIYHRANNTMTVYSNDDEVGTFTVTGCNYSNFYNILYIRNLGVGVNDYLIEYNVTSYPAMSVAITSPANITKSNLQLNVTYTVTNNATCDLQLNSAVNESMSAYESINNIFFVEDMTDGVFDYFINCTDIYNQTAQTEHYTYLMDSVAPFINIVYPYYTNTSVYSGYTMNITGNITDDNLYRVNISIFNATGNQFYNNYSGDLVNGTTSYLLDVTLNTTTWTNGIYTLFVDSADSHTDNMFTEDVKVTEIQKDAKYKLELSQDKPEFELSSDLKVEFIKAQDRVNFKFITTKQEKKYFIFKAEQPLVKINSEYPCHYVFGKYWFDCVGMEKPVVTELDPYTIKIDFDMFADTAGEITGDDPIEVLVKSLGGLNENNETILFEIDNCAPAWVCSDYGTCAINDTAPCDTVIDSNYCGLPYTGDYSEFVRGACDYCTVNITDVVEGVCIWNGTTKSRTTTAIDSNFATCCNITGLNDDCAGGAEDYFSLVYISFDLFYDTGNITVQKPCYFESEFVSEDLPAIVIDGSGKILAGIATFAILIGMFLVVGGIIYTFRKIKR